jgi:hypothetical protein
MSSKGKLLTAIPSLDSFFIVSQVRYLNTIKSIADMPFMLARQIPNEQGDIPYSIKPANSSS